MQSNSYHLRTPNIPWDPTTSCDPSAVDPTSFAQVTTSAQGEGAIEGVYTDYQITSPFDTNFKYGRFDAVAAGTSALSLSASVDDSEKD